MSYIEKQLLIESLQSNRLTSHFSNDDIIELSDLIYKIIDHKFETIQKELNAQILQNKIELLEWMQNLETQRFHQSQELKQAYIQKLQQTHILNKTEIINQVDTVKTECPTEGNHIHCQIVLVNNMTNSNPQELNNIEVLQGFLLSCGIGIKNLPITTNESDSVINSIALFMGEHYGSIEKVYKKIKSVMQVGGSFQEYIGNMSQLDVSNVCQWCNRLYSIAFLEQYTYQKSPKFLIRAKTTTLPIAHNFISGQWLERFVTEKINATLSEISNTYQININATYLINPQIILPNGDDFELDILYEINNKIYWIESKTGNYQQYIQKYSKMAKMLNLGQNHAILVLTDSCIDCNSLSHLFGMNVMTLESFGEQIKQTLLNDFNINSI